MPEQGATMVAMEGSAALSGYKAWETAAEGAKLSSSRTGPHKKTFKTSD